MKKISFLSSLLTASLLAQSQGSRIQTNGSCSPVVSGNNNTITLKCTGVSASAAKQMVDLLNAILSQEPNRRALDARLDSIIDTIKGASGEQTKKFDELSKSVACSSATPDAMATAINAHSSDRVIEIWRCRPENLSDGSVCRAFVNLFSPLGFPTAKPFLDKLRDHGLNVLNEIKPPQPLHLYYNDKLRFLTPIANPYNYHPLGYALSNHNMEALEWIARNAPPQFWKDYPYALEDLRGILQIPWRTGDPNVVTAEVTLLRNAGISIEFNDYRAYREAYTAWRSSKPGYEAVWKGLVDSLAPQSIELRERLVK